MNIHSRKFVHRAGFVAALCTTTASGAIYTVGTGGMYDHLQDAIDVAILNAGDDEIRVHTGTYTEGFTVPSNMSSNQLKISGGWGNGYSAQVRNGTLLTLIVPPVGTRAGWLYPSGGSLTVSNLHFFDAATTTPGAALLVMPTNDAAVTISNNVFEGNVVESTNNLNSGGAALSIYAVHQGQVNILSNALLNNRAAVAAGNIGLVYGGAIDMSCGGTMTCLIADNDIRSTEAMPRGSVVFGGAVRMALRDSVQAQFDRNLIDSVTVGPDATQTRGRSLFIDASGHASMLANSNRIRAGWPIGGSSAVDDTRWDIGDQAVAVFSDSLVAQSPRIGVKVSLSGSGSVYLTNLTLADNAGGVVVSGAGATGSVYLNNCLVTNVFDVANFPNTVFNNDQFGLVLPFVAPSLYDYSLRAFNINVADAGNDSPPGGLGFGDVDSHNRVVGPHVDIGAWESSDRIFADRIDP